MPAKHQPDHAFLRHVPLRRVHLFTLVQILCLAVLWILKSTMAAIIFPVMVRGPLPPPAPWTRPGQMSTGRSVRGFASWWPDSLRVTEAGTEQDWGCESRPDGAGEMEKKEGEEGLCGGENLQRQLSTPSSTQLSWGSSGRIQKPLTPFPTHALWGGMEKLGKCNKETEVPTAEIQAKCRNRSVFNINPFTTQTN